MADSDLSVKVSADVSGIGAAMAEAQRTLSRASADLQTAGNAEKQASVNFASLAYNTRVLIDEFASGRTSRMTGSLVRITEELAAGRAMLFGMIGGAAAATAGIAYMAVEAAKARASVEGLAGAIGAAGNAKNVGGANGIGAIAKEAQDAATRLESFWDVFGKGSALAYTDAQKINSAFGSVLGASNELLAVTPQLSRQMKGLFPEDFMSRLQTIANGLGDVDRTIPDLLANTINLSVHQKRD